MFGARPGIVERDVVPDAVGEFDVGEDRGVDVVASLLAAEAVDEVEVVARRGALFGILHPAVFPVVVGIDARRGAGHVVRGAAEVVQFARALVSPQLGAYFQPFGDLRRDVGAQLEPLGAGPCHDARVVDVGERHEVFRAARRSAGREVVLVVDVVFEHRFHPVGVGVGDVVGVARVGDAVGVLLLFAPEVDHRLREGQRAVDVLGRLVHQLHVVGVVRYQFEVIRRAVEGHHAVVRDVELAGITPPRLGGDEHYAVGAAVAVDGARGGVFEHRHRLDVIGADVGDRALEAIDDDQRRRVVERSDAADAHQHPFLSGLSRGLRDHQSGVHALQELGGRGHGPRLGLLGVVDRRHGAGDVHALLDAVSDHHEVFDKVRLGFQRYVDAGAGAYADLLRGVSEVAYHEGFVRRGDDLELAVRGGAHAAGCIGDSHGGPDEGFPGIIKDSSRDPGGLLLCEGERRCEQQHGQDESLF